MESGSLKLVGNREHDYRLAHGEQNLSPILSNVNFEGGNIRAVMLPPKAAIFRYWDKFYSLLRRRPKRGASGDREESTGSTEANSSGGSKNMTHSQTNAKER
jgi:hypothetical protein